MRKILAPHKGQDGWVYVRVRRCDPFGDGTVDDMGNQQFEQPLRLRHRYADGSPAEPSVGWLPGGGYYDGLPHSRIISSKRVEEDVETGDYLKRCAEDGLTAIRHDGQWAVGLWCAALPTWPEGFYMVEANGGGVVGCAPTLRGAYFRYHAAVGK